MKIVIGGQIDKNEIFKLVKELTNDQFVIEIKSDLEAAMAVQSGEAKYYIGACNTGGGGALAMAFALLGPEKCATLSMPGSILSDEEIINEFKKSKVAFGFTAQDKNKIIPILCKLMMGEI